MTDAPHPERISRSDLESGQLEQLRQLIRALESNRFYAPRLRAAGLAEGDLQSLSDLRRLPPTRKSDLVADQIANPLYGTNLTYPLEQYHRLHQTSGTTGQPMRWLDTPESWGRMLALWEQLYAMIGLRPDDRLCFPFSFGPFLGFWAAFEGASRLGNFCLAAGGMSSQARLALIMDHGVSFLCCTPTYALRLTEVAAEQGVNLQDSAVRGLIVAGEPGGCQPGIRRQLEDRWGARVFDHWGMTEIGPLAIESEGDPGHLQLLETACIPEIIDPQTLEPCPPGVPGELIITTLYRWGSPLLRYRTGDIVRAATTPSPTGSQLLRLEGGIMGRSDEMLTIRGNNFYPAALEECLRQFPEVAEYRIRVHVQRAMQHVQIEIEPIPDLAAGQETPQLLRRIANRVKDRFNFQAELQVAPPGSLPRFEMKGRRFERIIEE